ncbi:MAG: bifunctional glutamate N-acetyltransferase/amino-acid acetyltransferase ArgJ [Methylophilaceae bacterium]
MSVNLKRPNKENILNISGIKLSTAESGLKYNNRKDLALIALDEGAVVAGVFTKNQFIAAPVEIAKSNLNIGPHKRAFIINTGSANAGTGKKGLEDAKEICNVLASSLKIDSNEILPFSTGVIMAYLPTDKIKESIPLLVDNLNADNWLDAAEAIMTTDTIPKAASTSGVIDDSKILVTGISKGSGMINPNMATMLAFIGTNANINAEMLQELIKEVTEKTFNKISVDGETSTNDSFIIVATNKADHKQITSKNKHYEILKDLLMDNAMELSQAIIRDGEGATKFIEIVVEQGENEKDCDEIAKVIANSALVKTAFFASDPNLGRILAALGNAQIEGLDPSLINIFLNDLLFAKNGSIAADYTELKGSEEMNKNEICLKIQMGRGLATSTMWTTDLSYDYVKINSEYRT